MADAPSPLRDFLVTELGRGNRNPKAGETADKILELCQGKPEIHPLLVLAQIYIESGYNPRAVSSVGARGLMQLMPATAAEVATKYQIPYSGPEELFDPVLNVQLGVTYALELYRQFRGHWPAALTAYNRGPGNTSKILAKHNGVIPEPILDFYASLITRKYLSLIKRFPAPLISLA